MSVIVKTVRFRGSRGERRVPALFDNGATYSCIRPDVAKCLAPLDPLRPPLKFGTAKGGVGLQAKHAVRLDFFLGSDRFSDEFMVIVGLSDPVIIGAKTLQSWRMRLDFEHDKILYDPKVTKLRIVQVAAEAVACASTD